MFPKHSLLFHTFQYSDLLSTVIQLNKESVVNFVIHVHVYNIYSHCRFTNTEISRFRNSFYLVHVLYIHHTCTHRNQERTQWQQLHLYLFLGIRALPPFSIQFSFLIFQQRHETIQYSSLSPFLSSFSPPQQRY